MYTCSHFCDNSFRPINDVDDIHAVPLYNYKIKYYDILKLNKHKANTAIQQSRRQNVAHVSLRYHTKCSYISKFHSFIDMDLACITRRNTQEEPA